MTQQEAKAYLLKGYIAFGFGFLLGFPIQESSLTPVLFTCVVMGYTVFSIYHGIKIVKEPLLSYFDFKGVHIKAKNVPDLFSKNMKIKHTLWIIILIVGCFVGILGGAIIRQITLSRIAYL